MASRTWLTEQEKQWQRLEALLKKSEPSMRLLSAAEMRELALLYRSAVNDLSRIRSLPDTAHLEPYLNSLVQRGHGRVYVRPPVRFRDVADYFLVDFPRCFRKNGAFIAAAFLTFALGAMLAMATVSMDSETERFFLPPPVIDQLDQGILWMDRTQANPSESAFLMTNNIRVAINAFAFGMLLGVGTLILMFHNGMFALGGPLQICLNHGMGIRLLAFITPHGVLELTTIFIAGGAGMMIGYAMLFPEELPRGQAIREKAKEALILILGCCPLLVIAGLIEGMISLNRDVETLPRLLVAFSSLLFLIGYLGFSGREKSSGEAS